MAIIWWQKRRLRLGTETGLQAVVELVTDGSAKAFGALAEALLDPTFVTQGWSVREAISNQIAKLGPRAADPLLAVLARPQVRNEIDQKYDLKVRENAVKALADLGDMRALMPLREILRAPSRAVHSEGRYLTPEHETAERQSYLRVAAVRALAQLDGIGSVSALTGLLARDDDDFVRRQAASELVKLEDADASTTRSLRAALKDHYWGVRNIAAKALQALAPPSSDLLTEIEPVLEDNLSRWLKTDSEWFASATGHHHVWPGIAHQYMPRSWVEAHLGEWDHGHWLDLLKNLQHSAFWPMDPERIAAALDVIKTDYLREVSERQESGGGGGRCRDHYPEATGELEGPSLDPPVGWDWNT